MVGSFEPMNPSTLDTLRIAIAESIANRSVPSVRIPDIEKAIAWIERTFDDVDWDPFPDRITIFGDDPSVPVADDGDGDEGHFVLHLVFPVTPANPYAE